MPPTPHVDKRTLTLLTAVTDAAADLEMEWMVVGATGRMLLLEEVYGLPHGRATQDVDLGVMVEDWSHYHALVARIRRDQRFLPDLKQRQRLHFDDDGSLDLVPFGNIEAADRIILWPPGDFAMNVTGFREAYADSRIVTVDGLAVRVVSPVGLVLLKLVAWKDRHHLQPRKDAADIAYVLRHFAALLTEDALFGEHIIVLEAAEFDLDFAASRVLGQKMAGLVGEDARERIASLLAEEMRDGPDSALVREIGAQMAAAGTERVYELLRCLTTGFEETAD